MLYGYGEIEVQGKRKHLVNVRYFDVWSQKMAYVLGFITADGNVHERTLSIHLASKDREVLEFVRSEVCPHANLKEKKGSVRLRINSVELVKSLLEYNVVPRKSSTIRANFDIPSEFRGDYVRGVFDGDGCVLHRRNSLECVIVSASKLFLHDLRRLTGIKGSVCKQTKNSYAMPIYRWSLCKNDSLRLRDLMYRSDGFCLSRKKGLFFSKFYEPSKRWWTEDQIGILKSNMSMDEKTLAKMINKSVKAVSKKKWELRRNEKLSSSVR